jgi:tetratricopeptide (TPR) repeat protein
LSSPGNPELTLAEAWDGTSWRVRMVISAVAASPTRAAALYRDLGDQTGQACALNHLGLVQQDTGDYPAAAASHQQALSLARDAGDLLAEAVSLTDVGLVQQMTGDYPAAAASYQQAAGHLARRAASRRRSSSMKAAASPRVAVAAG